jgi:polysaccharide export outer membrane protein
MKPLNKITTLRYDHRNISLSLALFGALALSGCDALPASGPTEAQVLNGQTAPQNQLGFHIVTIDASNVAALQRVSPGTMAALNPVYDSGASAGTIGPGDILSISIFEVGNSLFAPATGAAAAAGQSAGPSGAVSNIALPAEQVDDQGTVTVPYAGRITAAGLTPDRLAARIEAALSGQSQNPQVIVTIDKDLENTVIVSGDIRTPGRYPLTLAHERLLDIVAIAGGTVHPEQDVYADLTRDDQTGKILVSDLQNEPDQDVYLAPGDQINLSYDPRSFSVFGAAEKVQQIDFGAPQVSLAEALARAGGPSNQQADPEGVFLFRFEDPATARALGLPAGSARVPVVYRLDMLQPTSYFVAQEFPMHDQDVLYISNARTDKVGKFFGLISALVQPAATGAYLAQ